MEFFFFKGSTDRMSQRTQTRRSGRPREEPVWKEAEDVCLGRGELEVSIRHPVEMGQGQLDVCDQLWEGSGHA